MLGRCRLPAAGTMLQWPAFIHTVVGTARHEEVIKKSRFVGLASPVKSAAAAAVFLNEQSNPKATHKYANQNQNQHPTPEPVSFILTLWVALLLAARMPTGSRMGRQNVMATVSRAALQGLPSSPLSRWLACMTSVSS